MLRTRAPVAAKVLLPRAAPRLACVKPIASVHPEPGSNSPLLLQFCFVFLLAPWDDVLFDTYSLSLRISLLICLNDGILVYHLFFFRSFMYYTTVRCCFISLCSKPFKDRFICPVLCHSAFPLAKDPSCRSASVLSDAPFFGVGTAKVVTYFLLTKFAVRKVPLPRLIHPPLPFSQPCSTTLGRTPIFELRLQR